MLWSELLPKDIKEKSDRLEARAAEERNAGKEVCPAQENIFKALQVTTPENLKVCIVGQDPYHTPGQANGLAFSVSPGCPLQPSLKNIFSELVSDIGCPYPTSGDLTAWAKQGVLLLNTSLTVEAHMPNSHVNWGWQEVTKAIFKAALTLPQPIVFLLWGGNARKFMQDVNFAAYENKKVLTSSHPSPFSAATGSYAAPAFLGSRPFSKTNELLTAMGSAPIQWQLP